ncbi:hypothetical protein [Ralstonia solanacearum]|uniref:hypothetical protein n=1 Tax=Ralstonia solanacearum TaxID=305 RepID=UPI0012D46AF8|nr:hypothetical protein [Ralstonia solanacearum]MDC6180165.1 hypothetical protein [Ralstonia solanacearum]MDC6212755.1 hypothetical protein [Ralstonia solanacearum]MDC6241723.1 hypothetical protein [Ralstonia solanacearum]MDD7802412.1 hypothetical protein [Ralstonia solanacearum]
MKQAGWKVSAGKHPANNAADADVMPSTLAVSALPEKRGGVLCMSKAKRPGVITRYR